MNSLRSFEAAAPQLVGDYSGKHDPDDPDPQRVGDGMSGEHPKKN